LARAAMVAKQQLLKKNGFSSLVPGGATLGVRRADGPTSAARRAQLDRIPIGVGLAAASLLTKPSAA